jgi:hypothetical protein
MNTLEFLQRVLPAQGRYVIAYNTPGAGTFQHKFVDNVENLAYQIRVLNGQGMNVYYAPNSYGKQPKRVQDNVLYSRALYMDIDCGPNKPFSNQKKAVKWLSEFTKDRELPMPMVVSSGNGLHVYWLFNEDVPIDEWQPLADALKAAVPKMDDGFMPIDQAITSDSARILRPVGCTNRGVHGDESMVAKLIIDPQEDISLDDMKKLIGNFQPMNMNVKKVKGKRESKLASLSTYDSLPPADASAVYNKCKQVKWAVDNQGSVMEPQWYNLLGVAAYCENPEDTAKAWSDKHPNYTETETLSKMNQWLGATTGPATCARFEQERPAGCAKCPFAGKVTSPVQLGVRRAEKEVDETAPTDTAAEVPLPSHFRRTDQGIAIDQDGVEIVISKFDIYPHSEGWDRDRDAHVYRFVWKHPRLGWKYLVLPTDAFTSGLQSSITKFITESNRQGMAVPFKGEGEKLQMFLRGYIEELKKVQPPLDSTTALGWVGDKDKFVLGDKLFIRESDGSVSEHTAPMSSAINHSMVSAYSTKGTLNNWVNGTEALSKHDLKLVQLSILFSLASPLIGLSGLPGATVNFYGESGAGKTLAQHVALSVYGNPQQLYTTARGTINSVYAQLATRNNLPMMIDEATVLPNQEIGRLLMGVTEGQERPRLDKNANMKEPRRFSTIVQLSANKPMGGLIASSGYEVAAQFYRVLDLLVYKHPAFSKSTKVGGAIYHWYSDNCGVIGDTWVKHLVSIGRDALKVMYQQHANEFQKKYDGFQFQGEERYWEAMAVAADMAGSLAKDLGFIKFDERAVIKDLVLSQIPAQRSNVEENNDMSTPLSVVSRYLNEVADCTATLMHTTGRAPMTTVPQRGLKKLLARIDLHRDRPSDQPTAGTVTLDKRAFRDWLIDNGSDIRSVEKYLGVRNLDRTPPSGRITLDKDIPDINVGQVRVISIDLDCPELEGILDDSRGTTVAAPKKLNLVTGGLT